MITYATIFHQYLSNLFHWQVRAGPPVHSKYIVTVLTRDTSTQRADQIVTCYLLDIRLCCSIFLPENSCRKGMSDSSGRQGMYGYTNFEHVTYGLVDTVMIAVLHCADHLAVCFECVFVSPQAIKCTPAEWKSSEPVSNPHSIKVTTYHNSSRRFCVQHITSIT
jgi:hypothetical protein